MEQKKHASKPTVLIIEDDKSTQLLYKKVFPEEWFEVNFADDGQSGLNLYESLHPDLIILDMMLPVLTGYVVLQTIRKDHHDPSTKIFIASSLSSKDDIIECSKLGIQGYLLKPFNFREIRRKFAAYSPLADIENSKDTSPKTATPTRHKTSNQAIQYYCTAFSRGNLGAKETCVKIMVTAKAEKLDLPSMPDIIFKIQEAMSKDETTFKDLANLIINDQNITSKLISLSNSAFYKGSKSCETVEDSILRVGLTEAKEICFLLSNRGLYALQDQRFEEDLQRLSNHSIACGFAARMIAEHHKKDDPFSCFTLGVLHDIGRLALIRIFADAFKNEGLDIPFLHQIINKLHNRMGALLLESMGFPSKFQQILLKHHQDFKDYSGQEKELPIIVVANMLANKLGYHSDTPLETDILTTNAAEQTQMDQALINKVDNGLTQYFEMLGSMH